MLALRSQVDADGTVRLWVDEVAVPEPRDHEVLIRLEASPINPSDLGVLLAGGDPASAVAGGSAERPTVSMSVPPALIGGQAARLGQAMPIGNEGGGVVVAAGASPDAQALVGKVVGVAGGAMYAQYRAIPAAACLVMPDGVTPAQAASPYVNPMTALGMVETMKVEGHTALVHTAAASNLGQMLVKICLADGVPLVNIVRRDEQVDLLRSLGATHVVNSSSPAFGDELTDALADTGATIAFDATGGGRLANQILHSMEAAITRRGSGEFQRYGSAVHKQVYIYGGLDRSPLELTRSYGMAWGVGGWLLTYLGNSIGAEGVNRLRQRVVAEITTTFASHYTATVSLAGALDLDALRRYSRQATGEKYLITPHA